MSELPENRKKDKENSVRNTFITPRPEFIIQRDPRCEELERYTKTLKADMRAEYNEMLDHLKSILKEVAEALTG